MYPTFVENQKVRVQSHSPIERGDTIIFYPIKNNREIRYLKRVIGLPGEHIAYREGKLYINHVPTEDPYSDETFSYDLTEETNLEKIPPDNYFVLGDNRIVSVDSRFFGVVKKENIIGIVTKGEKVK